MRDRKGTEQALAGHQDQQGSAGPGTPGGEILTSPEAPAREHQQAQADQKGVQAVKPLQEDLEVHLATRQEHPVAERPVGTGQTSLHHPRGTTDRHQGDQGDHEVAADPREPLINQGEAAGPVMGSGRSNQHVLIPRVSQVKVASSF